MLPEKVHEMILRIEEKVENKYYPFRKQRYGKDNITSGFTYHYVTGVWSRISVVCGQDQVVELVCLHETNGDYRIPLGSLTAPYALEKIEETFDLMFDTLVVTFAKF